MKIFKYETLALFLIAFTILSCGDDDEIPIPELRDRGEQQLADKDSLQQFLSTHYFNEELFVNNPSGNFTVDDIVIQQLDEGDTEPPAGNTLLINSSYLETKTTTYLDVSYEYYILRINQGGGANAPKFTDNVRLNYEGALANSDHSVFDSTPNPVTFDLLSLIYGWSLVIPEFNPASGFVDNGDGTETYIDSGLGVMFLPSGLAYFASAQIGIPAYTNIYFKFNLFKTDQNDHDSDGVPSYLEDLNNDLNVRNDNTDEDNLFNFGDADDDGDGISTFDEHVLTTYTISPGAAEPNLGINDFEYSRTVDDATGVITLEVITLIDSDGNGEFDYLESNIAVDNITSND